MTLKTSAFIGTTASIDSASLTKSADTITLQNGLHQFTYPREVTFSGTKEVTLGKYWGIYDSDHVANDLFGEGVIWNSVTWTRSDVVTDRRMTSHGDLDTCASGTVPDGSQVFQYTDAMIWTGYTETISANITCSDYSITAFKPGDRITGANDIVIFPAVGTASNVYTAESATAAAAAAYSLLAAGTYGNPLPYIWLDMAATGTAAFDQHFIVTSISHTESQSDWHTVDLEFSRFVPMTSPTAAVTASALLPYLSLWQSAEGVFSALCNQCSDYDPTDLPTYYSLSITVTLTSGGNPTYSETIEIYPDEAQNTNYSAS